MAQENETVNEEVTEEKTDEIADDKALDYLRSQEAEVKEETKEEAKTEEKVEAEEEVKEEVKKEKKFVPLEALHEEREKRKELKERLDRQEQRFQELVEKFKPKEDAPVFDSEEDKLRYEQKVLSEQVQEHRKFIEQQNRFSQQQQQEQVIIQTYAQKAKEFAKETPDFSEAYNFLYQSRQAELTAAGYPLAGDTRRGLLPLEEYLKREELSLANAALQDEVNPAERVYNIAKARGYVKKSEVKTDKLENIEKGIKDNKTLSGATGSSPKGLTLEALADMDDEDFSKLSYEEIQKIANR